MFIHAVELFVLEQCDFPNREISDDAFQALIDSQFAIYEGHIVKNVFGACTARLEVDGTVHILPCLTEAIEASQRFAATSKMGLAKRRALLHMRDREERSPESDQELEAVLQPTSVA